jgi:hypothetical protein
MVPQPASGWSGCNAVTLQVQVVRAFVGDLRVYVRRMNKQPAANSVAVMLLNTAGLIVIA